jgi:hypothetical protein
MQTASSDPLSWTAIVLIQNAHLLVFEHKTPGGITLLAVPQPARLRTR